MKLARLYPALLVLTFLTPSLTARADEEVPVPVEAPTEVPVEEPAPEITVTYEEPRYMAPQGASISLGSAAAVAPTDDLALPPTPKTEPKKAERELPLFEGSYEVGAFMGTGDSELGGQFSKRIRFNANHRKQRQNWWNLRPELQISLQQTESVRRIDFVAGGVSVRELSALDFAGKGSELISGDFQLDTAFRRNKSIDTRESGVRLGVGIPGANMSKIKLKFGNEKTAVGFRADLLLGSLVFGKNQIQDKKASIGLHVVSGDLAFRVKAGEWGHVTAAVGGDAALVDGAWAQELKLSAGLEGIRGTRGFIKYVHAYERSSSPKEGASDSVLTYSQDGVFAGSAF